MACEDVNRPITGVGVIFQRFNGVDWDAISNIVDITTPNMERDMIETSDIDSEDGYRDFITGWKNGGSVTFNMNFTRSGYDIMFADFNDDEKKEYRIIIPDDVNSTFQFYGYVQSIGMPITLSEQIKAITTIKVTGKPTLV